MATAMFDGTSVGWAELGAACPVVPGATVSKPLLNGTVKVIVFAMDAGQEISEHRAPYVATVHVLDGRLDFGVGKTEREMVAGSWLVMPPNEPHRLRALEPTRFVLTMVKDAAKDGANA